MSKKDALWRMNTFENILFVRLCLYRTVFSSMGQFEFLLADCENEAARFKLQNNILHVHYAYI